MTASPWALLSLFSYSSSLSSTSGRAGKKTQAKTGTDSRLAATEATPTAVGGATPITRALMLPGIHGVGAVAQQVRDRPVIETAVVPVFEIDWASLLQAILTPPDTLFSGSRGEERRGAFGAMTDT